ncbi:MULTISPECIES: winged helix-turn-helix domain-containing protein [Mesorhizobium]|uniref:winged helix-turn-helix domain-containing protein n=1 Tax=Mesorhizobium TaxID=68287 RepID=UPI001FD98DBB|nr:MULTISPECIES: winged helix-turn-helix domain-containing protein [Mesorhizobium]
MLESPIDQVTPPVSRLSIGGLKNFVNGAFFWTEASSGIRGTLFPDPALIHQSRAASAGRSQGLGPRQIYEAFREQILAGVYERGSQLPSSRDLANELGVSGTTVRSRTTSWAAEGFIEVIQGARTRVCVVAGP